MKIDLKGRKALIAGGSRGIGFSIAEAFAKAGADVAICARSQAALDQAAASLKQHGGKVLASACDLGDADAIKRWVGEAQDVLGGIDCLV
ncbi:MAG: SDR family NAD(P)-dependent oxidoreductase, partial [Burkholderiales bacterium]